MGTRSMLWVAMVTACYGPTVPEGAPCSSTIQCPSPQVCSNNRCSLHATPVDVPIDQAIDSAFPIDAPGPDAAIDAPATPGACLNTLVCPNGGTKTYFQCLEDCFIVCSAPSSFTAAQNACDAGADRLARINSQAVQTCVEQFFTSPMWIGAHQDTGQTLPGSGWRWPTAVLLNYTNWGTHEPTDSDGIENNQEDCAAMAYPSGRWFDTSCTTSTYRPLCEIDN